MTPVVVPAVDCLRPYAGAFRVGVFRRGARVRLPEEGMFDECSLTFDVGGRGVVRGCLPGFRWVRERGQTRGRARVRTGELAGAVRRARFTPPAVASISAMKSRPSTRVFRSRRQRTAAKSRIWVRRASAAANSRVIEGGNEYLATRSPTGGWTQSNLAPAGQPGAVFQVFSE